LNFQAPSIPVNSFRTVSQGPWGCSKRKQKVEEEQEQEEEEEEDMASAIMKY
jgi:hypothetical protein